MNEIELNILIEELISNQKWGQIFLTIIPAICTCFGFSLKDIAKGISLKKNRRALKYTLLNKIPDESLKKTIWKFCVLTLEMFLIIINSLIMVGIAEIFILFVNISTSDSYKKDFIVLVLMMTVVIIIAAFIGKYQNYRLCKNLKILVLVFCESILIIMLATLYSNDSLTVHRCMYVLMTVSLTFVASIIYTFYNFGIYRIFDYSKFSGLTFKICKYIMIIVYNFYFFIKLQIVSTPIVWTCVWIVINALEYICLEKNDYTKFANITIHKLDNDEMTKDKVIQYEGNKIGYKTLDGTKKIIDSENIKNITYQRINLYIKKCRETKVVKCTLKDGTILQYQGYKFITDLWAQLYKTEKGIRDVFILKITDIKEIEVINLNEQI